MLAVAILGSSMAFIDGTAVNVALPALQSSLKASLLEVQWVVESYTLFLGALLLTCGSLGDLFGPRKIFTFGVVLFAAASAWCGVSPDVHQLILARSVQGIGASMLVPNSLALLSVSFSRKDLGVAIGIWSGATSITSALGPVLGGWLAQHASWRWVFAINVPIAFVVFVLALWRIPNSAPKAGRAPIDWTGTALATVGLGGLVYGLLQSSWLIGLCGLVALIGFVVAQSRERAPMLPLTLFRSSDFSGTSLLTFFLYGALSGALFFLPLDLVKVQGYGETAAGLALLPLILLMAFLSRWSARLLDWLDARILLIVGPLIVAAGFGLLAVPGLGGSYWTTFFPAVMVLGFGMAATVAPLTTTVMRSVDQSRAGIASGVNNALSRIAGLLSIALFGLLLKAVFDRHYAAANLGASAREIELQWSLLGAGGSELAVKQSFVAGFRAVMWLSTALCVASALTSMAFIKKARK